MKTITKVLFSLSSNAYFDLYGGWEAKLEHNPKEAYRFDSQDEVDRIFADSQDYQILEFMKDHSPWEVRTVIDFKENEREH